MKNKTNWSPSKFEFRKGRLRASNNRQELSISSVINVEHIAAFYDIIIKKYVQGSLLDLGCGKVPLYEAYKPYIKENICADWEKTLHKNSHIDIYANLNITLPFDDNTFDTIILSDVLEHIEDPNLLWKEMNRVLKESGFLILNVPFNYWIHESPHDFHRFTRFALEKAAVKSNFKVLELYEFGGSLEVLLDTTLKFSNGKRILGRLLPLIFNKSYIYFKKRNLKNINYSNMTLGYGLVVQKHH
jgi:SAM-dependent methyltransferase